MSHTKHLNKNRQFAVGIFVLVFVVLCVVVIFLMMCYDRMGKQTSTKDYYEIELNRGFAGDSLILAVNDSVLFNGVVTQDTLKLSFKPFDESHMLSVGDPVTGMAQNNTISIPKGRIILKRTEDKRGLLVTEQEW
ncbi:MAG: hypothetical protein MJZ69_05905 [Bacteroidaceae bacterium]|nr:hypothetical protein [Candidatus Minthousia equi]MCQ2246307.1 hypothetical protein [Bacteroidaceae bacterium]MDO4955888.1 hypothetical protein [Bacteroidales bacterium]